MSNIATALRDEITRVARKEIRGQTETLRKASAVYRGHIAELKRRVAGLERKVVSYQKQLPENIQPQGTDAKVIRYSAKRFQATRKRLGLSAADYGKLIGVSDQTVYRWESGKARPRKHQMAAYAALRGFGKKEARARLEELRAG
ncbi:MAG: helix-turn-helix transcriptional regulator [Gammaproteobacteria bacterium]|nr:helix-turn-helix transcriptional regulator [Gammaproteobacteria bacterium]MCZ6889003.1 helix-turn-helix transcriptional regulator [Gammaproteobacteria bacterium]